MAQILYYSDMPVNNKPYKTFRIPVLLRIKNNDILAFAEARKNSPKDNGIISIVMRRSVDNGKSWSLPNIISEIGNSTLGNPCPILDEETGVIHLLLTWNKADISETDIINGKGKGKDRRLPYYCKSDDNGFTWTNPQCIATTATKDDWFWYATGPCNGIQIQNGNYKGRLVAPCNHTIDLSKNRKLNIDTIHRSHVLYSDDKGATWLISDDLPKTTNESSIIELNDGSLMNNMRLQGIEHRGFAISTSGGENWINFVVEKRIQLGICQGSILRIDDDILLMSCVKDRKRECLTIFVSFNMGKTWSHQYMVYNGSSSYSNMIKIDDDNIGIIYEQNRYTKIIFDVIPIKNIIVCDKNAMQNNFRLSLIQ